MIEQPKDGGPAFPIETTATPYAPGMSLRDWFAGQAMTGELASWTSSTDGHECNIARRAYQMADAMIAAREVKP